MPAPHKPELKGQAVGYLLSGIGPSEVARRVGLPIRTIEDWQKEIRGNPSLSSVDWLPVRGANWQENFNAYIDDTLYAMRVQVAYLSRPDVLERSDYGSIVDAHGSFADRITRVAETVGRIEAPQSAVVRALESVDHDSAALDA